MYYSYRVELGVNGESVIRGRWFTVLSISASAAATPAAADVVPYAGLSYSEVELELANAIQSFSVDRGEAEILIFGGILVGEHFAAEGSFVESSGCEGSFLYETPGSMPLNLYLEADYQILTTRAIGKLSLGQFDFLAGLGVYNADFDGDATYSSIFNDGCGSSVTTVSQSESGLSGIAGIAYRVGDAMAIRLDFEWFDMEPGTETSIASLGFTYRFN